MSDRYDLMFRARKTPSLALSMQLAEKCRAKGTFGPHDCPFWDVPEPNEPFPYGFCQFDSLDMLKLFFGYGNWAKGTGVLYHDLAFVNQIGGLGDWWALKYDHEQSCWVSFDSISFYILVKKGEFEPLMERLDAASAQQCKDCTY